jgi:hypothetical protein
MAGVIDAVEQTSRTFVVKQSANLSTKFAYRDDTKLQTATGSSMRFDELSEMGRGLPIAKGDKVRITWRMSSDGSTRIAEIVLKTP